MNNGLVTDKPMTMYLGLHIETARDQSEICIRQTRYMDELLERFHQKNRKPVATPMDNSSLENYDGGVDTTLRYWEADGALMFFR